jgi:hypothetical protein
MTLNKASKDFIAALGERAIKSFAQTFVAIIGATATNVFQASTLDALRVSASAALLSVMTSLASAKFGPKGPSLANESIPTA